MVALNWVDIAMDTLRGIVVFLHHHGVHPTAIRKRVDEALDYASNHS